MKVRSNKIVNIRTGKPYVLSGNLKGSINPGFDLEVEVVPGQDIKGNSIWYQDKNGDYYWSGGFEGAMTNTSSVPMDLDYGKLIKANYDIPGNKGEGVKVVVIDSGIQVSHPAFGGKKVAQYNSIDANNDADDVFGHGTHVAGIIAAMAGETKGVAPNVELCACKAINDSGIVLAEPVGKAIQWAMEQGADVVNLSLDVGFDQESIVEILDEAQKQDMVIVAAAGENRYISSEQDAFLFPANHPACISVGAVSNIYLNKVAGFRLHDDLDFALAFEDIKSSVPDGIYRSEKGSSMSTALVSGLIARILSAMPADTGLTKKDYCLRQLYAMTEPYVEGFRFENNYQILK